MPKMSDSNRWKWGIFSWYGGCTSCLLLLVVTLGAKWGMGGEETERDRGRGRVRKSELFSQTWSLSLTKLQAPKPQCRSVPKGTTLQKLTSKPGWSQQEEDNFTETNKPHNLTVTLKNSNFLWTKLSAALKYKSTCLELLSYSEIYIW